MKTNQYQQDYIARLIKEKADKKAVVIGEHLSNISEKTSESGCYDIADFRRDDLHLEAIRKMLSKKTDEELMAWGIESSENYSGVNSIYMARAIQEGLSNPHSDSWDIMDLFYEGMFVEWRGKWERILEELIAMDKY